ncbi:hypothetical protein FZ103_00645 [Streptomonospora sp. PA3]|uniref:hypothetical protein n=1 Tax=Streptomonospora sp. PA3 TaxID=2607326 RepID=UPI0012DD8F62|nr:hypothetical protein [Streptomonospora sp. PA3]MUL39700.1 hypothetical protein [Streptomonospora sp. PA3]
MTLLGVIHSSGVLPALGLLLLALLVAVLRLAAFPLALAALALDALADVATLPLAPREGGAW